MYSDPSLHDYIEVSLCEIGLFSYEASSEILFVTFCYYLSRPHFLRFVVYSLDVCLVNCKQFEIFLEFCPPGAAADILKDTKKGGVRGGVVGVGVVADLLIMIR